MRKKLYNIKLESFAVRALLISSLFFILNRSEAQNKGDFNDKYNPGIDDNYTKITDIQHYKKWGTYNIHDPAAIKVGNYYYLYSTDAIYWPPNAITKSDTIKMGNIHVRKSKDLVHWDFVGWALDTIPSEALSHVKEASGGQVPNGIWAPYVVKSGNQFRMYYSVSAFGANTSCIGMVTSDSPEGPWKAGGLVVKTNKNDAMNAIDPTVVTDAISKKQWMIYGSYFGGIYCLELNTKTGLAMIDADQGICVARRAEGTIRIIEAPEVIYNSQLKKYFLFVSYEPLFTHYNVRVGRADKPEGPYYDFFGKDMATPENNYPLVTFAYRFKNHEGWFGVAHCGVLNDNGQYYMFHQGRLAPDNMLLVLHARKMFWTNDGWPVVSPERYVNVPQTKNTDNDIVGNWEKIDLKEIKDTVKLWQGQIPYGGWHYGTHQFNNSYLITFLAKGKIKDSPTMSWKLSNNVLSLTDVSKKRTVRLIVSNGWDWENKRKTIVFTGLSPEGLSVWGKKVE